MQTNPAVINNSPARTTNRVPAIATIIMLVIIWMSAIGMQILFDRTDFDQYSSVGQRLYLPFYIVLAFFTVWIVPRSNLRIFQLFDPFLILFLLWAALTITVSAVPEKAATDLLKHTVFLLSVAGVVSLFPTQESLVRFITYALLLIVLADVLAVALVPHLAIHQVNDALEANLAGQWRGLHPHKAKFGEVLAFALLLILLRTKGAGRNWKFAIAIPLLGIMLMSGAKTALGTIVLALLAIEFVRFLSRYISGIAAAFILAPFAALMVLLSILFIPYLLKYQFGDTTLSGRTRTWDFLWHYSMERPWMGSGFSSFFIGEDGPLYRSGDYFLMRIGNAHNSFFDMLVTTGWPGAVLAFMAFLIVPIYTYYSRIVFDPFVKIWIAIIIAVNISSMTTVGYFQTERLSGLMLMIAYFALRRFYGPGVRGNYRLPDPRPGRPLLRRTGRRLAMRATR